MSRIIEIEAYKANRFILTRFNKIALSTSSAYLIKDLIPREGLTVVWGPLKCGKSFWTFTVAMHIACGADYRGRRVKQGAVVYLALEGGSGFKNRVEAYRQHHDIADAPFYLITDRTDLIGDHHMLIDAITKQTGNERPVLIVIDTLNRSLVGSENKDEDMARYIAAADAIRETFHVLSPSSTIAALTARGRADIRRLPPPPTRCSRYRATTPSTSSSKSNG